MTERMAEPLVSWEEIQDIELVVLRRMKEFAMGAHPSVFHESGFDLVGLRDWQPGDPPSAIDWPQSTLTNFSPLLTREFEQESTAPVVIIADTSLSTRCGVNGTPIAKVIARTVATLGLAAAFLQDLVGLVTIDGNSRRLVVRPRAGRNHALQCVEAYQKVVCDQGPEKVAGRSESLAGVVHQRSVIPVVSDFLIDDPEPLIDELVEFNTRHDLFVVVINSAFAFELPSVSDGWVKGYDIETGRSRVLSTSEVDMLGDRVRESQDATARRAREAGLDVARIDPGDEHGGLAEFLRSRRRRKK